MCHQHEKNCDHRSTQPGIHLYNSVTAFKISKNMFPEVTNHATCIIGIPSAAAWVYPSSALVASTNTIFGYQNSETPHRKE